MKFALDDYIDEYIQNAKSTTNKKIAAHLKEIIPQTTHLNENVYNEIILQFKKEIKNDKERNFENAFFKVCEKYILNGDIIEAELPDILTKIIPNKEKFMTNLIINIENRHRKPYTGQELKMVFASKDKNRIIRLLHKLKKAWLSRGKAVFATFDEQSKSRDPFLNRNVIEIINMLALDKHGFEKGEPYTAVKIRYKNSEDIKKRYPTFIDAGWRDTFWPADKYDKYGRTRSLDPSLSGMPELVHENIKLSHVEIEEFVLLEEN